MPDSLMSITIQRRCVAVALFVDRQLERMEVRHLSNDSMRASVAIHRLVARLLRVHSVQRAVVEAIPEGSGTRRADLARLASQLLADRGIPVSTTDPAAVRHAFSIPPCRTRKALREIVAKYWPALLPRFRTPAVLDAAALGLYTQVQRSYDH